MTSFGRLNLVAMAFGLSLGVWCSVANATGSDGAKQTCVAAADFTTHPNKPQPNVECGFDADLDGDGVPEQIEFVRDFSKVRVFVTVTSKSNPEPHRYETSTDDVLENDSPKVTLSVIPQEQAGAALLVLDVPAQEGCDSANVVEYLSYSPELGLKQAFRAVDVSGDVGRTLMKATFHPDKTATVVDSVSVNEGFENEYDSRHRVEKFCLVEGKYVKCPMDGDVFYVQASRANVRPKIGGKKKVTSLGIGEKVWVQKVESGWSQIKTEQYEGWIFGALLGENPPTLEGLLESYHSIEECEPVAKDASTCTFDKLKERRKWAERAAALAPRDPKVVGRLIETLERSLAYKGSPSFASDSARKTTAGELELAKQGVAALTPVYFVSETFTDSGPDKSEVFVYSDLSCRKHIVSRFAKGVGDGEWSSQVGAKKVMPVLEKRCYEFSPERNFWTLTPAPKSKRARWKDRGIRSGVKVRTNIVEPCTDEIYKLPHAELTFRFEPARGPAGAALFLSSLEPPTEEFIYFDSMKKFETKPTERTVKGSGPRPFTVEQAQLHGKQAKFGIKEIVVEKAMGCIYNGVTAADGSQFCEENQLSEIKVLVHWESGPPMVLYHEGGYGDNSYIWPAEPDEIILSDFNADGSPDFLLRMGRPGETIWFQMQGQEIVKKHILVKDTSGFQGGC